MPDGSGLNLEIAQLTFFENPFWIRGVSSLDAQLVARDDFRPSTRPRRPCSIIDNSGSSYLARGHELGSEIVAYFLNILTRR